MTFAGALPSVFDCHRTRTLPANGTTNFLSMPSELEDRSVSARSCKALEGTSTLPVSLVWPNADVATKDETTAAERHVARLFMLRCLNRAALCRPRGDRPHRKKLAHT